MRRFLFDTTRLQSSGLHTGIQRVVRSLIAALKEQVVGTELQVLPVVFDGAQWFAYQDLVAHPLQASAVEKAQHSAFPVELGEGDTLLLFDASWYGDPWPAVDRALAAGARLCGMVHDLLPVEQAGWFRKGLSDTFTDHLESMARRADVLLAPSKVVADRLESYLQKLGAEPEIQVLAHGGDFHSASGSLSEPPGSLHRRVALDRLKKRQVFLTLGTLEPRKNHSVILDAFDSLWSNGSPIGLVMVGREGWEVDPLMQRIKNHPLLDRQLFHLENLDDASLMYLLRNVDALIYVSSDEGFGLPVLEAALQGCPVVASDIPVLREVGGRWPCYVPLGDPEALKDALEKRLYARAGEVAPSRTWGAVAQQLLTLLLRDDATVHAAAQPS